MKYHRIIAPTGIQRYFDSMMATTTPRGRSITRAYEVITKCSLLYRHPRIMRCLPSTYTQCRQCKYNDLSSGYLNNYEF